MKRTLVLIALGTAGIFTPGGAAREPVQPRPCAATPSQLASALRDGRGRSEVPFTPITTSRSALKEDALGLLAADRGQAVRSGRKALQSPNDYPWYDSDTDDLRPIPESPAEAGSQSTGGRQGRGGNDAEDGWRKGSSRKGRPPPDTRTDPEPETGSSLFGAILQVLAWIVLGLTLAAVVYMLVRAFILMPREKTEEETETTGRGPGIEALPVPLPEGRSDLLTQARRHYEQGNYRQAIIYLFSYQLVRLDKQQIIHLDRGKTNRQYLREVGPRQALRWLVEQTMVAFEDVFFGNRAIDRGRFESCWSRLAEFERLATQ